MVWKPSSQIACHRTSEMPITPTRLEISMVVRICDMIIYSAQG
jgi:hypothetical protein